MQIKVGQVVDTSKDVNLSDLKPMDKILASMSNAFQRTSLYKRRYVKTQEKEDEQKRVERSTLLDSILSVAKRELDDNATLQNRGETCVGVLAQIPYKYCTYLDEVLTMRELDFLSIEVVKPNSFLCKSSEIPYLLYIRQREVSDIEQ